MFCLFSLNSLGTSIIASLMGTNWDTITGQQKFEIIVAILVNWTGMIMAFFSKATQKVQKDGFTGFLTDPGFDSSGKNTTSFTKVSAEQTTIEKKDKEV